MTKDKVALGSFIVAVLALLLSQFKPIHFSPAIGYRCRPAGDQYTVSRYFR